MKIQPRNTIIALLLHEQAEKKTGAGVIVPGHADTFCEGTIVSVGPGTLSAAGGQSETFDLKPGQRVLVAARQKMQNQLGGFDYKHTGIELEGGVFLYEQSKILGIITDHTLN